MKHFGIFQVKHSGSNKTIKKKCKWENSLLLSRTAVPTLCCSRHGALVARRQEAGARRSLPLDTLSTADKTKGGLIELRVFTTLPPTWRLPHFGTEHPVRDLRALCDKRRAPVEQGQRVPAGWAALSSGARIKPDVRSLRFVKGNQRKLRVFDHFPGSDTRERSSAEASTRRQRLLGPPCEAPNESTKQ